MVRPRRAMQCLPKEDATPQRDACAPTNLWCGRSIPSTARSPLRGDPSGHAPGSRCVALPGIVLPATTCVARLMIIPILPAARSARICSALPQYPLPPPGSIDGFFCPGDRPDALEPAIPGGPFLPGGLPRLAR